MNIFILFLIFFCSLSSHNRLNEHLINIDVVNETSGVPFIDCIYLINLDKRPDRLLKALRQFDVYGVKINRVSAIDGWLLNGEEKQRLMGHYPLKLSGGQIGCILSHLSVLNDAVKRQYKYIWVCEDDLMIKDSPQKIAQYILQLDDLAPDWDVLYTDPEHKTKDGKPLPSLSHDFRPDFPHARREYYLKKIPFAQDLTEIHQRYGTYSMILSQKGAKKILDYFSTRPLWTSYDIDLHYVPSIRQFSLTYNLVTVDPTFSSDIALPKPKTKQPK